MEMNTLNHTNGNLTASIPMPRQRKKTKAFKLSSIKGHITAVLFVSFTLLMFYGGQQEHPTTPIEVRLITSLMQTSLIFAVSSMIMTCAKQELKEYKMTSVKK